jgi:ABC-2 type transport system permease protein
MKVIDIALKDLLRSLRSAVALVFMFVLPLLTTGIFYFAFGGLTDDDGGFDLPQTKVQVVNQDLVAGLSGGQTLTELLQDEQLSELLQVSVVDDPDSARAAVDQQKAGVAVIIPADFSQAATLPGKTAAITLYQDPTLSVGPGIVESLVSQFVDGFAGASIASSVVAVQLSQQGLEVDEATMRDVANTYSAWAQALGEGDSILDVQPPPQGEETDEPLANVLAEVMVAMIIFYAFFTGASTAQTILQEDEAGTLARLFTTPTPQSAILGGKFLSVFITLIVQVVVLLLASVLVFGVDWGQPLVMLLMTVGLVVVASGFGVMLISFLKSTRQAGPVMGGVLTISGMAGGLFTSSMPNPPAFFEVASLLTPHGWALRGWKLALDGTSVGEALVPVLVTLGLGAIFFVIGALFFRKRFA